MKKLISLAAIGVLSIFALVPPAHADDAPQITPSLKKLLGGLPIAGIKDEVNQLVGTLKKTQCGGGLTGCYATKSGPLQLYFFTSGTAQQTFLLVVNQNMALPPLLKPNVQKIMGQTSIKDPIISISTSDYVLDLAHMPADLQKVVRDSYFNVPSLSFTAGVQLAARANIGGAMLTTLAALGVPANQLTLRAGVVMPIPTDLAGLAGSGAGLADALRHSESLKKAGADALHPGAFIEFQPAPGLKIQLRAPAMVMSDSTFFLDNELVFGYKGNARFANTARDILLQFQTPLTPAGVMDLADFSFRMATPPAMNLTDLAYISMAMYVPQASMAKSATTTALEKFGGGYINNIKAVVQPLRTMTNSLSVMQYKNPNSPAPYRFGDPTRPFPTSDAPFNLLILGPLADGGPRMYTAGAVRILGQDMGRMELSVGMAGFQATAEESLSLKLGPLGNTKIKMLATVDINAKSQKVNMAGNLAGQKLSVTLAGDIMGAYLEATCAHPFEIKFTAPIEEKLDIGKLFNSLPGVNVDPAQLQNCIGKDLEKALNTIANEYSNLSGYSAKQANAALKKISDDAQKVADAAYKQSKDAARALANSTNSLTKDVTKAFNDAGNSISHAFGGKKHRSDANDKFDRSVFNWDYYYDTRGTAWGNADLLQHWADHGYAENKRASKEFDMQYYRSKHPGANNKDLLNTWLKDGINRCEQASPDFSLAALQRRYPGKNCRDTYNWYFDMGGPASGLNGTP